jgi:hypothetical protein
LLSLIKNCNKYIVKMQVFSPKFSLGEKQDTTG